MKTAKTLRIALIILFAAGLFAADFDLLTRLAGLETLDIVATEDSLAAGFGDRLREMLPGIEELAWPAAEPAEPRSTPGFFMSRDREEELAGVARSLKGSRRAGGVQTELDRTAVVFRRPLPYVYLAATVFDAAGIPFQAADALPLAAEAFAAALDLVFSFVTSGFSRASTAALLACPHFAFDADDGPVDRAGVSSLDRALADAGYLGGREDLARIAASLKGPAARGAQAALRAADAVAGTSQLVQEALKKELPSNPFTLESSTEVGPAIGKDLQKKALLAVVISLAGIVVYIAWRFKFDFGVAATIATFHDVLAVLGVVFLLNKEITLLIVTALLTIGGYSLTDTVVVYDRIRENLRSRRKEGLGDVINASINQVLSRTAMTSLTVLLAALSMFLMGGEVIHDFSFALLIGVLVGTYSSWFVASPLIYEWRNRTEASRRARR
jgi:preprotein translocase subunit SecF